MTTFLKKEHLPDKVDIIFVNLDPERSSGAQTFEYAQHFGENVFGLSGTKAEIDQVTQFFNAYYKKVEMKGSEMNYTIDHSSYFYLIDPELKIRKIIDSTGSFDSLLPYIRP